MFKNSDDAEYLIDKILGTNNFFDEHPCKLRHVIGMRKCEEGVCPFALPDDYCAVLALRSGGLEHCRLIEKQMYERGEIKNDSK